LIWTATSSFTDEKQLFGRLGHTLAVSSLRGDRDRQIVDSLLISKLTAMQIVVQIVLDTNSKGKTRKRRENEKSESGKGGFFSRPPRIRMFTLLNFPEGTLFNRVNFPCTTAAFTVSPEPGALTCCANLPGDWALYAISVPRIESGAGLAHSFALRLPSDDTSR